MLRFSERVCALVLLAGCAAAQDTARVHVLRNGTAYVVEKDRITAEQQSIVQLQAGGEIEASATDGVNLYYATDPDREIWVVSPDRGQPRRLDNLGHDADALCAVDGSIFVSDGGGTLFHYWVTDAGLVEVRRIGTNPDIDVCSATSTWVYVLDPWLGVIRTAVDEELDTIFEPVITDTQGVTGLEAAEDTAGSTLLLSRSDSAQVIPVDSRALDARTLEGDGPWTLHSGGGYRWLDGQLQRARAPSLAYAAHEIPPVRETQPVPSAGDAADDPAILVDQADPSRTWILGTDKQAGLRVYDLAGKEVRFLARGRVNNVDAVRIGESRFIAAASNRTLRALDVFVVDLSLMSIEVVGSFPLQVNDPYGLCMTDGSGIEVFVGGTEGTVERWQIAGRGRDAHRTGELIFDGQTEGCVVDHETRRLFVGEEARGIWAIDLNDGSRILFDEVGKGHLVADVEGLSIHRRDRVLIASSQGDNAFVRYRLDGDPSPIRFRVTADRDAGIDGVSETDGLDVTDAKLPGFEDGLLVVQDGRNRAPEGPQNFKLVDWRLIHKLR